MKKYFLLPALLVCFYFSFSQTYQFGIPATSGPVMKVEKHGNLIYMAGDFGSVGINSTNFSIINKSNSYPLHLETYPNGPVNAVLPDGNGGWFIGGFFNSLGTTQRPGVARINGDGSVHAWNVPVYGNVKAMLISGNTMYIGGEFTSIGQNIRMRLAAIDINTGNLKAWNPSVNGTVNSLALVNNKLYAGGEFTSVNGITRNNLASVDTTTGVLTSWDPNVTAMPGAESLVVNAITYHNGAIYIGGAFEFVMGQGRKRLAAIDTALNNLKTWNPATNGEVTCLLVNGNSIFVGGIFTAISGFQRQNLALLDAATGAVSGWNPNYLTSPSFMRSLFIEGNILYVSADNLLAMDLTTGIQKKLGFRITGGKVHCTSSSGSKLFLGGEFTFTGFERQGVAAYDPVNKVVTEWNANLNDDVNDFIISGNTMYLAGKFLVLGGSSSVYRNKLAAVDLTTGIATNWNPNVNDEALTLAQIGNNIVVGGKFTTINGSVARNRVAMVDMNAGTVTPWNPNVNALVYDVEPFGGNVYIGGDFTSVSGLQRDFLALVDGTSGQPLSWNPSFSSVVRKIKAVQNSLYVGGQFFTVNGLNRRGAAKFEINTGNLTTWEPFLTGTVFEIVPHGDKVYFGGDFMHINYSHIRPFAANADSSTGADANWDAYLSGPITGGVRSLYIDNDMVIAGGIGMYYGANPLVKNLVQYGPPSCMPVITQQPSSKTGCEGASISFSVTTSGTNLSYQWKVNGNDIPGATSSVLTLPAISNAMNGNQYSVVVGGTGCTNVSSTNATLTVSPKPNADFTVLSPQCAGQNYFYSNLSSGAITETKWDFGDGTTLQNGIISHTFANAGTYAVKLIVKTSAGCADTITRQVVVQVCTAITGVQETTFQFALIPNLVHSSAIIDLESTKTSLIRFSVLSVTGNELMRLSKTVNPGRSKWPINVSQLPAGFYLLRAVDGKGISKEVRFLKQ